MESFIHGLPKLELHLHIEGTLTPERKLLLARRNNLPLLPGTTASSIRQSYTFTSLPTFLKIYYDGMKCLLTTDDFYDLAMDYLTNASSQNVRYVELFFDPQAHTGRGIPFKTIVEGLIKACKDAEREMGIIGRLVMCFLRDRDVGWAEDILTQSLEFKEFILGVGLDSDEHGHPPLKFQKVFERARDAGYKLTMHADVDQTTSLSNISEILDVIQTDRIDHGVNAVFSPDLVQKIAGKKGMGLTVCPISNRYVTGNLCEDRILKLMNAGVRVTINSDDPSYMGEKYVEENLLELQKVMGLTKEQIVQFQNDAVEICWADERTKERLMNEIDLYFQRYK